MIKHNSLSRLTVEATAGLVKLTSVVLCCRLCCVQCCFHLPAICCPLLGPALDWQPPHWSPGVWEQDCLRLALAEGCSAPGSLHCLYSPWSHGGACPHLLQPAWPHCSVSWPGAGRGELYRLPGVDARLCGAQLSCSSRSGHFEGRTAPTTGYHLPGVLERLQGVPSRTHQWSSSHTYAHGSVAPRSPPNQSWMRRNKKRVKVFYS